MKVLLKYSNYYPHGSVMPGLNYQSSYSYKYGYQGQFAEKDDETNESFFELRNYDALLGRFKTPDPYEQYWSPYLAMGNSHPNQVDPDGGFSPEGAMIGMAIGAGIGITGAIISEIAGDHNSSTNFVNATPYLVAAGALGGGFSEEIASLAFSADGMQAMLGFGSASAMQVGMGYGSSSGVIPPRQPILYIASGKVKAFLENLFKDSPPGVKGGTLPDVGFGPVAAPRGILEIIKSGVKLLMKPQNAAKIAGRIQAGSLKEFKALIQQLSKPGSKLTQAELDQLRTITKRHGGTVRVDLSGVKGTGTEPHVHIEGLGKSVESRHIWLDSGVK